MKMPKVFILVVVFFVYHSNSYAQTPTLLSYQGVVRDTSGVPKTSGEYSFTFSLYDEEEKDEPLWSESKVLLVQGGLFSTQLGDSNPIDLSIVTFDKQYWLGIEFNDEGEMRPRMQLSSVGYSFRSVWADSARVGLVSIVDSSWTTTGDDIYRLEGNIGLGKLPGHESKMRVQGDAVGPPSSSGNIVDLSSTNAEGALVFGKLTSEGVSFIQSVRTGGVSSIVLNPEGGNVGIGNTPASATKVFIEGNVVGPPFTSGNVLDLKSTEAQGALSFGKLRGDGTSYIQSSKSGAVSSIVLNPEGGNVGIGIDQPTSALHIAGTTSTRVLEITGGSDLAEPFLITNDEYLAPGTVVVIDTLIHGQLNKSTRSYDARVAGIISGAGGVNTGISLSQDGMLDQGQQVALSGRVYVLASAVNGSIKPGDLLTTSSVPGHAMKATNRILSFGAVLGKAMSELTEGEGLVLVLVSLQ